MIKVRLLIGDDFHSQLIADTFLTRAKPKAWPVSIMTVERRTSRPSNALMRTWRDIETSIFPALIAARKNDQATVPKNSLLQNHFNAAGAVSTAGVTNVNDEALIAGLAQHRDELVISVRCYQKFSPKLIRALTTAGRRPRLLNLHPGRLPRYRGAVTYLHQLARHDPAGTHSLHIVSRDWDDGPILTINTEHLAPDKSLATNYFNAAEHGANLLFREIERAERVGLENYLHSASPQQDQDAGYFSVADAVTMLETGPVTMFDMNEICSAIAKRYGKASVPGFVTHLREASRRVIA